MTTQNPATDQWEAVYYTNPIPLSSRTLLAFALLFDRVHTPGVSIPHHQFSASEKAALRVRSQLPLASKPEEALMVEPYRNFALWSTEQPALSDFVHLPDDGRLCPVEELMPQAHNLLEDTYGAGVTRLVLQLAATEIVTVPDRDDSVMALTWPLYQARALQYAHETGLPLISDDLMFVPPLPAHSSKLWDTKTLAQQLAIEAVSLVLPKFQSVEPEMIPEFRHDIQNMARPFRVEMVKMTAEVSAAISAGEDDTDLKALCRHIAQSKVLPAMEDLSRQLREPLRPWHRTALDVTEAVLSAATSAATNRPEFVFAWALLRGAKIASNYVDLYTDRQGKKRSGLAYLLKIKEPQSDKRISEWDRFDWRCSGNFDVPEPGRPLTPENRAMLDAFGDKWGYQTVRRVWQHRTASWVNFIPKTESGSAPPSMAVGG